MTAKSNKTIDKMKPLFGVLMIAALVLLLLIPVGMIRNLISERQSNRDFVIEEIGDSWSKNQKLTGPILLVPYKEKISSEKTVTDKNGKEQKIIEEREHLKKLYILPNTLQINGNVESENRYRGIYKVPVYKSNIKATAEFDLQKTFGLTDNLDKITWLPPQIIFTIPDPRGIQNNTKIFIDGEQSTILPGIAGLPSYLGNGGMHVTLKDLKPPLVKKKISLNMEMGLHGIQSLAFTPVGEKTNIDIKSNWPHPSFKGLYLPKERKISKDGFSAAWQTSWLATGIQQQVKNCFSYNSCEELNKNSLDIEFIEGVDIYQQADRAVKYAVLFIALTFGLFFLFGTLKSFSVHVIQYLLSGCALALFYLVLVSLSEHIAFHWAYLAAAAACVSLLSFYSSFVLGKAKYGVLYGTTLAALYGTMYIIINSEDYALLMGSVLLFGILAVTMTVTRRIDWNQIDAAKSSKIE